MINKNNVQVALTFIGAVVGAGFASGQELVRFFVVFQSQGPWGALLSGLLFAFLGSVIILAVNKTQASNYGELLQILLPFRGNKLVDLLIAISLWSGLGVMVVGSSTLLENFLGIPTIGGFMLTGLAIYLSLVMGNQGLLNANSLLVPFLILIAIGSSLLFIINPIPCLSDTGQVKTLLPNWWVGSLIYVAYNMVLVIVVMSSIGDKETKISPISGAIGGGVLGIMAFIMVKAMLLLPNNIVIHEMPMISLTALINPKISLLYTIALWVALFTTALANGHSLAKRLTKIIRMSYRQVLFLIIGSTIIFIPWSFSALIAIIYPLLGYLGLPLILSLIFILPSLLKR